MKTYDPTTTPDDTILTWLCSECTVAEWASEPEWRLMAAWRDWAKANDHPHDGRAVMRRALAALGCWRRGGGDVAVWCGVTLHTPEDDGAPATADRQMRRLIARNRRHIPRPRVTMRSVAQSRPEREDSSLSH